MSKIVKKLVHKFLVTETMTLRDFKNQLEIDFPYDIVIPEGHYISITIEKQEQGNEK